MKNYIKILNPNEETSNDIFNSAWKKAPRISEVDVRFNNSKIVEIAKGDEIRYAIEYTYSSTQFCENTRDSRQVNEQIIKTKTHEFEAKNLSEVEAFLSND